MKPLLNIPSSKHS